MPVCKKERKRERKREREREKRKEKERKRKGRDAYLARILLKSESQGTNRNISFTFLKISYKAKYFKRKKSHVFYCYMVQTQYSV